MNFDFLGLKKSISKVQERLEAVRLEQASIRNQIQAIQYAPSGCDDVKEVVARWVSESADAYWSGFRASVKTAAKEAVPTKGVTLKPLVTFGAQGNDPFTQPTHQQIGEMLCAVFSTNIVKALHQEIDAIEWPENAVPIAFRRGQIEKLERAYAKLTQEEAELLESARDAGLSV